MADGPHDDGLFDREARHREDLLTAFEEEWFAGDPPDLPAFVRRFLPPWLPRRGTTIAELIRVDQEFRIKNGEPSRVESYFSNLAFEPDRETLLDLVLGEFTLRSRFQMPPAIAEYAARFPNLTHELRTQLAGWKEATSAEALALGSGTLLRIIEGPHRGTAIRLERGRPLVLGRAESADVRLDADHHLSRLHLRLELIAGRIYFRDLDSRNGTVLNDRTVAEGEITSLDVLRCGETAMAIEIGSSPEPTLELARHVEAIGANSSDVPSRDGVPGYEITEVLGRGRLGVTYDAVREATDETIVVKRIELPEAAAKTVGVITETASLRAIADPIFLLPVDIGLSGGKPYLVTPRHHPISFTDLTAERETTERLSGAARIIDRILTALAPLHRAGFVHGDLKESNVLLERVGDGLRIKVTDFGLARHFDRPFGDEWSSLPDDDLFAVGTLLWNYVVRDAEADLSSLPEVAVRVMKRAIDPDPGRRFIDASEFSGAIRDLIVP